MYHYKALCNKVIDGDTIEATIDLGFDIFKKEVIRLKGLDTPESRTVDQLEKQAGLKVKQFLINTIQGKEFYITTRSTLGSNEKFGRYLGEIFINENDDVSLNKIRSGHLYFNKHYKCQTELCFTDDSLFFEVLEKYLQLS